MSSRSFGLVREGSAATLAELEALRSQVHILLQQNEGLENELRRLTDELDTATKSIIQRGHLYKWRDREISYASKWGLRYFVLQGSTLSYYGDEKDQRPRRTFDLSRCIVRDEGTKKGGMYHVFSIYLVKAGVLDVNSDVSLLVRLSTESRAEAMQWMNMLEQACTLSDYEAIKDGAMSYGALDSLIPADNDGGDNASKVASPGPSPRSGEHTYGTDDSNAGTNDGLQELQEDWSNTQLEEVVMEASDLSPVFLKRVKSSNAMLKKCHSRQTMARNILRRRYPADFSASGNRLAQLPDLVGSGRTHRTRERSADVDPGAGAKFTIPKSFPGSKPMHLKSAPSPLSSDVRPGEQNYRGFFNLSVIILLLANARLFIDSHSKYGFMPSWRVIDGTAAPPSQWAFSKPGLSILSWAASILVSHFLEKLAVRGAISETGMLVANFAAGILNIVLPIAWVWRSQAHPGACMVYLFQSVILWMKLISYAHANRDLRTVWRAENKAKKDAAAASSADPNGSIATPAIDDNAKPVESLFGDVKDMRPPFLQYPHNITLYNLLYFCVAPTLCYQLNYPRSPRIRWRYAFSILVRLFIVGGLIVFSVEQYIKPTLENAILPMEEMNVLEILERILKLSIPNTYVWLLIFYFYFHLWLNLLAEVTTFGDRAFYRDWWNARTIDIYWRNWNLPVHHWMLRHLYYPVLRMGMSKTVSTFIVFLFSAVFHEVIISVPFRHIFYFAFVGMLAQAPLTIFTKIVNKRFDNAFFGNVIFWLCFCVVGQPLGIIFFYYSSWKLAKG